VAGHVLEGYTVILAYTSGNKGHYQHSLLTGFQYGSITSRSKHRPLGNVNVETERLRRKLRTQYIALKLS